MQKTAIIKCRPDDPPQYSGEFEIKAEFHFEKEDEYRLEDGRIVVLKTVGSSTRIITYHNNCQPARDHKIKQFTPLMRNEYAHT